jgi:hypothetical protein
MFIEKLKRDLANIQEQVDRVMERDLPNPRLPPLLEQAASLEYLIAEEEGRE